MRPGARGATGWDGSVYGIPHNCFVIICGFVPFLVDFACIECFPVCGVVHWVGHDARQSKTDSPPRCALGPGGGAGSIRE